MNASEFRDFTDRARRVLDLARQEAALLGHDYLASEHLLLGLASEGRGLAAHVLQNFDQNLDSLRAGVRTVVGPGPHALPMRDFPWTPRMKLSIDYAREIDCGWLTCSLAVNALHCQLARPARTLCPSADFATTSNSLLKS
jgi:ATP-dependent Clp protease ATP-binding subunit ClpA